MLTVITGLALPKLVAGAYRSELGLGRPGEAASSVVAAQRVARDVDESGHGGLWLWSIECAVDRVRVIYLSLLCGVYASRLRGAMEFWMESADGAYRVSEGGVFGKVPETVQEAMDHPLWPMIKKAMEDEITGKLANEAWDVVERPIGVHVMKSRWVFAVKYNVDGSIQVIKARFVACGYSQREGSDYDKVFAATLPGVSLRVLVACIADEDLETDHIDAVKAFTQPVIDIKNYCEMPVGFGIIGCVLLLLKALEGIKQGAFLWFQHNKNAWKKLGFDSWYGDRNLYYHQKLGIRVGVFADDTCVGYSKAA